MNKLKYTEGLQMEQFKRNQNKYPGPINGARMECYFR